MSVEENRSHHCIGYLVASWIILAIIAIVCLSGCCAVSNVFGNMNVGETSHRSYGRSQIEEMKQAGLQAQPYVIGMQLVPCIRWSNNDPVSGTLIPLTVSERLVYLRNNGGYIADCNVINDEIVWK